ENVSRFQSDIPPLIERLKSSYIELQDISSELQSAQNGLSFDEERIAFIQERMDTGYKLFKKHGVQSTNELLDIQDALQKKLDQVQHSGDTISRLENECRALFNEAMSLAKKLSAARRSQCEPFIKKVNTLLTSVGMKGARLSIDIREQNLNEY